MIKVGIIGAGRIGHVHGESISKFVKNATVKTIADPFMNEKTEAWAKSIGVEKTTKDYHEILNDPDYQSGDFDIEFIADKEEQLLNHRYTAEG